MPKIIETKIMNFSAKEIYDLVVDVESYPQFLPWCKNAQISKHISPSNFQAELLINFKNIFELGFSNNYFALNSYNSNILNISSNKSNPKYWNGNSLYLSFILKTFCDV